MKVVLDSRPGSGYSDTVEQYHFPDRYLRHALAAVGDWAILYEPKRQGGRAAYIGAARLTRVEPDPDRAGHHFAYLTERLDFDAPLPLRGPHGYREEPLRAVTDPREVGRALQGRSIRPVSDADFTAIVQAGLNQTLDPTNRQRLFLDRAELDGTDADLLTGSPTERLMERMLSSRLIRDAAFRRAVLEAYGDRCAVTRLRIVNGGGRAEAQAAHIVPVSDGGPDVVQNGIALSATAHWLFDRHLISIAEDWTVLVSHNKVPAELRALFASHGQQIALPRDRSRWPNPTFVERHRERFASAGG